MLGSKRFLSALVGEITVWGKARKTAAHTHCQGMTVDILSSFKAVKITGLAQSLTQYLQGLRGDELIAASRFRQTVTWAITLGMLYT